MEDRCYIIRDKGGKPIKMIGSLTDITEKKTFQEQLLENTIQSQEREGNRIARELHDGIVQEMTACGMIAENLRNCISNPAELEKRLNQLIAMIRKATNQTRDISHHLISADVTRDRLEDMLIRLEQTLNNVSDISFHFTIAVREECQISEEVKINLYRTLQELTNNIIKHSGASTTYVTVKELGDHLQVTVVDDGVGIAQKQHHNGIGLSNVRNRMESVGGTIEFSSSNTGGLAVNIEVPI